jgi:hypothetical protein
MGITGLWKMLHGHRDAKISPDITYVDGWYLVIRIATAMQTISEGYRGDVLRKVILSRRRSILSIPSRGIIIVYDGVGAAINKLPRASPKATDDIITSVVECIADTLGDVASIVRLPPAVEADDYIISNVTPADAIISDDSDMLTAGVPVIRFDGTIYMPDDVLLDLSRIIGRDVTLHQFRAAAGIARGDKRGGVGIIAALRST